MLRNHCFRIAFSALRYRFSSAVQYPSIENTIWCYASVMTGCLLGELRNWHGVQHETHTHNANWLTNEMARRNEMQRRWSWKIKLYNLFRIHYSLDEFVPCLPFAAAAAMPVELADCVELSTSDIIITMNPVQSICIPIFGARYRLTAFLSFAYNKQKYTCGSHSNQQHSAMWKPERERAKITRKLHLQFPVATFFPLFLVGLIESFCVEN